MLVKRQVHS
jgi:hypothetical protein